jgi:prepilin-type N-terminal cleavage/methylation domain-containing protein
LEVRRRYLITRLPPARRGTRPPCRRAEHGFSLLELLVSLVVLGLLLVALTQGVQIGVRAWAVEGRVGGSGTDLALIDHTLRVLLARALPAAPTDQVSNLIGDARTMTFVTTLPTGSTVLPTPEADATLLVADRHRLEIRWLPHYRNWIAPRPPPSVTTLLDEVDHLELGYWQPGPEPGGGGWLAVWDDRALPQLVRIRIVFTRESSRHWPDIVIALMRGRWRP